MTFLIIFTDVKGRGFNPCTPYKSDSDMKADFLSTNRPICITALVPVDKDNLDTLVPICYENVSLIEIIPGLAPVY